MFREFTAAVEQKQVAQQDAEKARFLVEKAEFVKKAAVIQVPALVSYFRILALTFLMSGWGRHRSRRVACQCFCQGDVNVIHFHKGQEKKTFTRLIHFVYPNPANTHSLESNIHHHNQTNSDWQNPATGGRGFDRAATNWGGGGHCQQHGAVKKRCLSATGGYFVCGCIASWVMWIISGSANPFGAPQPIRTYFTHHLASSPRLNINILVQQI